MWWLSGGLAAAALLAPRPAGATDPLNSSNRTSADADAAKKADDDKPHNDINIVPVAGGNSDIGIGIGYFAGLARLVKGHEPYAYNIESAGFITGNIQDGKFIVPYQDVYAKLTVPRIGGSAVRLELRPSWTWEKTLGYYGMGNNASPGATPGRSFEYARAHPELVAVLHVKVVDHVSIITGARYAQNWIDVNPGTKLADDLANGSAQVKKLIGNTSDAAYVVFQDAIAFDNRDNEFSSHRGTFDTAAIRFSPGGTAAFPYRYFQTTLNARGFVPLYRRRLTLALRAVGDVILGDAPFYELARYEDTYAIGGLNGVRGVPAQRYSGRVKVFGNAELRSELADFRFLKKQMVFGLAGFFDGGRVWADTSPHPELDGTGIGLKYGVGLGARLHTADTFVLRLDGAWSPDASPIAAYFSVGEMF